MNEQQPIMKTIARKPITFHRDLVGVIGSIEGALVFQQLSHWMQYGKRPDGFIYKTSKEIFEETAVTEKKQRAIRDKLQELGLVEIKKEMANGSPTYHYKVVALLELTLTPSTGEMPVPIGQNASSITKNTQREVHILSDSEKLDVEKLYKGWLIEFVITYAVWISSDSRPALLAAARKKVKLTDKRKHAMVVRLRDSGFEACVKAIKNAAANPWNHGENPSRWKADIEWLFKSQEHTEKWSNR